MDTGLQIALDIINQQIGLLYALPADATINFTCSVLEEIKAKLEDAIPSGLQPPTLETESQISTTQSQSQGAAPASSATFEPQYDWDEKRRNWYRKDE